MKNYHSPLLLVVFLLVFWLSCTPKRSQPDREPTPREAIRKKVFDIHRGVNISHWLSQSKARGEQRRAYFTEKEVMEVAGAGFDHIRIPIDEEQLWDERGHKIPEAFDLLHQALGWMHQHRLKALVDLHIVRAHHFLDKDPLLFTDLKAQEKFAGLWQDLSEELEKYPRDEVAYELLNESVARDHEDWNKVYRLAYDQVRQREPLRVIFIGPNRWQNPWFFPYLRVPENDPNIVLSFHFYIPMIITHYQASWSSVKDYQGPIHYPGIPVQPKDTIGLPEEVRASVRQFTTEDIGIDQLEQHFKMALAKADTLGLQLYCGEFGCYDKTPQDIRLRWYTDVIRLFEKHDIAWTAWDLKSNGFGVFNANDRSLTIPRKVLFQE